MSVTQETILLTLATMIERLAPRSVRSRTLQPDTELETLGIDSADRVDLLLGAEDQFQISISDAEFARIKTLNDFIKLVSVQLAVSV